MPGHPASDPRAPAVVSRSATLPSSIPYRVVASEAAPAAGSALCTWPVLSTRSAPECVNSAMATSAARLAPPVR